MPKPFYVYVGNQHIDTVTFDDDMTAEEVRKSLVEHDGADPRIEVREPVTWTKRAHEVICKKCGGLLDGYAGNYFHTDSSGHPIPSGHKAEPVED